MGCQTRVTDPRTQPTANAEISTDADKSHEEILNNREIAIVIALVNQIARMVTIRVSFQRQMGVVCV